MTRGRTKSGAHRTDASRMRRDRYRKKLDRLLSMADDEGLFHQIWAITALQRGRPDLAARCIKNIPKAALDARLGQPGHIAPWDLETLVNERLMLPPAKPQKLPNGLEKTFNTTTFAGIDTAAGYLRLLENADIGVVLERLDVMKELPRITHRQFEWQRGFVNAPQFYRWAWLFGGELCQAHFQNKTGLSIADFILFGFAMNAHFNESPIRDRASDLLEIGLSGPQVEAALDLMTTPMQEARAVVASLRTRRRGPAYQPSLLRTRPMISFGDRGERLRAPIPELIIPRVTSGLFYDLADAPTGARNEAGKRFEQYTCDLINGTLPGLKAAPGAKYKHRNQPVDEPDVLCSDRTKIVAVFECKARKMSFDARFSETSERDPGLEELAKGVFQIWRFFAHSRLGLVATRGVLDETVGVLLTLDNWMQMSSSRQKDVLTRAEAMASAKDPLIQPEDRRTIVFSSVEDLESTLERTDETLFIQYLKDATEERFTGWMLPNIHREVDTGIHNPYPLFARLGEVLPWWDGIQDQEP